MPPNTLHWRGAPWRGNTRLGRYEGCTNPAMGLGGGGAHKSCQKRPAPLLWIKGEAVGRMSGAGFLFSMAQSVGGGSERTENTPTGSIKEKSVSSALW